MDENWARDATAALHKLLTSLYIELTISFLIARKRTVNFRNQRLWRHNCRLHNDHVKVMGNHVKVTGKHVVYDHGAWFLRVIMSSSLTLSCLPSVKKQKHDFSCFVQCLSKGQPLAPADTRVTPTWTLIILDITKTSSNNCLKAYCLLILDKF